MTVFYSSKDVNPQWSQHIWLCGSLELCRTWGTPVQPPSWTSCAFVSAEAAPLCCRPEKFQSTVHKREVRGKKIFFLKLDPLWIPTQTSFLASSSWLSKNNRPSLARVPLCAQNKRLDLMALYKKKDKIKKIKHWSACSDWKVFPRFQTQTTHGSKFLKRMPFFPSIFRHVHCCVSQRFVSSHSSWFHMKEYDVLQTKPILLNWCMR